MTHGGGTFVGSVDGNLLGDDLLGTDRFFTSSRGGGGGCGRAGAAFAAVPEALVELFLAFQGSDFVLLVAARGELVSVALRLLAQV